jgi:hypothetical protein
MRTKKAQAAKAKLDRSDIILKKLSFIKEIQREKAMYIREHHTK